MSVKVNDSFFKAALMLDWTSASVSILASANISQAFFNGHAGY